MKRMNLILLDHSGDADGKPLVFRFLTHIDTEKQVWQALLAAVQGYLATEDGQQALERTGGTFRWGDVAAEMPPEAFLQHGLFLVEEDAWDVLADRDAAVPEV